MTEPIAFPSTTPNLGLPLLFAGQSQKEFFVNQALAILDALAQRTVVDTLPEPPASVAEGDCFRVAAIAIGAWSLHADAIAAYVGGSWHFIAPAEGMLLFDRTAGQWLCFRSGWQAAPGPALPVGGTTIDAEARATLAALVAGLRLVGLLGAEQV